MLAVAALVVFTGYVVFGVTGFGASPITIPILALFLDLATVLALSAILDVTSAVVLGFHARRQATTRELLPLVAFTLAGLILGVTLLLRLPRQITLVALGIFICAYAVYTMLRRARARRLSRAWAIPAGVAGGVLGAMFGVGGPPYVAYITGRVAEPAAQRATISQMVVLSVGLRVVVFAVGGLLSAPGLWTLVVLLLPAAWTGLWVGHRVHLRVAPAMLARIIAATLFLTGASLVVRNLSE